jgi:hypothetical protein
MIGNPCGHARPSMMERMYHISDKQHRSSTITQPVPVTMGRPASIDALRHPHSYKTMKNHGNIIDTLNGIGTHVQAPPETWLVIAPYGISALSKIKWNLNLPLI